MAGTLADAAGLPAGKHAQPALTKLSTVDCEATPATAAAPAAAQAAAAAVGAAGACESTANDDFLLSSFQGKLSLAEAEGPAGGAGQLPAEGADLHPPELAAEESAGSTASAATSMGAPSSSVLDSPQVSMLDSPLAAFAAARDRLLGAVSRGNASGSLEAGSLPSSALSALNSRQQEQEGPGTRSSARRSSAPAGEVKEAAAADGSAPDSSLQPRRLTRSQSGSSSLGSAGSVLPKVAALQQKNLRLKERLQITMAMCNTMQEQNKQSIERVEQLRESNQRLSRSLQGARLDKDGLQHTMRQLSVEAAMLAEQARQALVPLKGQLEEEAQSEAAEGEAAARTEVEVHQQQEEQGGAHSPEAISISAIASPTPAAGQSPGLASGGSAATSVASRVEGAESRQEQQSPGVPPPHADSASSSLAGASQGAAVAVASATGDKRRRLLSSLAPVIVEAAAEAAAAEVSVGSCRVLTPGYTPRRKIRHAHTDSQGTAAATAGAAAADPAAGLPAAAADPEAEPPAAAAASLEPAPLASSRQQPAEECSGGVATPGSSGAVLVTAVADVVAAAQGADTGAAEEEEYEFETFALFDRIWFGCHAPSNKRLAAPLPLLAPASRGQLSSGIS